MAPSALLALCAGLCLACVALAQPLSPAYDTPLPSIVRICVLAYPPFVMQRVRARFVQARGSPSA
jgi:hypothetical protein